VCTEISTPAPEMLQAFDFIKMANAHLPDTGDIGDKMIVVEILDDSQFSGTNVEQLLKDVPSEFPHTFLFVFDQTSASQPDHPILVIDLFDQPGRTFRAIPSEIHWIESNLSISNMDWEDFADCVDEDGVFRGFPDTAE